MNPNQKVVTRFAPSPTGFMHIGGIRTAIYGWLYARKHGGTFILRIEDTDKEREIAGSIAHIVESLAWLGLTVDAGPILQSSRLEIYKLYAQALVDRGLAYPDPYTEEELAGFRAKAEEEKRPFLFRDHRPDSIAPWDGTQPLRFRVPEIKRYEWDDVVRGHLSAGVEALDDFILIKGDGYPTYNFAHIIDDDQMGVTHIVRGEEFISSTPRFLSLYNALNITPPHFVTVPVILGPDGKKKLSKRDGAKDVLEYRTEGYLPEAIVNYLALLGWHPEDDREVLSITELTAAFDLPRIQKGGAKFDPVKLRWFNQQHIEQLSATAFEEKLHAFITMHGRTVPTYFNTKVAIELKNRSATLAEAEEHLRGEFSFLEETIPTPSAELLLQGAKADAAAVAIHLKKAQELLQEMEDAAFSTAHIKECLFDYATEQGRGAVLWPLRVALSGKERSPDPFTVASLIGKDRALLRIAAALMVL